MKNFNNLSKSERKQHKRIRQQRKCARGKAWV